MVDISDHVHDNFDDWFWGKAALSASDDAPSGMDDHMNKPIEMVALRLGQSITRLKKFMDLDADERIVESEIKLSKKHLAVLRLRITEFESFVYGIHHGSSISPEWIGDHITHICCVLALQSDDNDE